MRAPAIQSVHHTWKTDDGCGIHARVWEPARQAAPRGVGVLYLHGIQSHGGWFEWSAGELAKCGLTVVMPDRRGSGRSEGPRGDAGNSRRWIDDIHHHLEWIKFNLKITRLWLVGVSWGGKTAVGAALEWPAEISRVLLLAPGIFPAVGVGLTGQMRIGASLVRGGRNYFPIPLNDPALFTDNPTGQAFIAADTLKLTHATARFLWHSRRLDRRLARLPQRSLQARLHVVLAEDDRIIRNEPTIEWAKRICSTTARIDVLPGQHHTFEFASDVSRFRDTLAEWAAD